jgi:hypothetical protein
VPGRNEITLDFLRDKQLVVKLKIGTTGKVQHIWYRGTVGAEDGAKYSIDFDDGETLSRSLGIRNYGETKWWVIVEPDAQT